MTRLLLGALAGAAVVLAGLALVGDNSYGVLAVALAWVLVIRFIARDPSATGDWPRRRG